ncbi:TonB-dependent siderophore receptor [Paucibacter sp. PLA-PC-4]|uniref:TonB-dependent siderophore receptor n=1 Tax=Paucibacter sp. PLA-PC-4 TaxID=2993655 RepID=UPI00224B1A92|nr:TonB-dependent siderophore receptor [Paucibacter sp. PLA-PC-4]MCX2864252.1 TonB-dependent siderophore receptor [Paucibacter sp. PLA-PC-4]
MHPKVSLLRLLPAACLLGLPGAGAWAQQGASADAATQGQPAAPVQVEAVVIYGSVQRDTGFSPTQGLSAGKAPMRLLETPRSLSIVTREVMDSRQITSLQQALQTVPGVSPVNFGRRGFDDINIRGFRSTESILVDGLVQSPGMWTKLTSYAYERFEVLKGASSILYGQVQPGGLVNAISKRPERVRRLDTGLEVGSFGQRTLSADINQPLSANGRTALRLTAQASNGDDPTDFVYRKDRWLSPSLSIDFGRDTDFVLFSSYSKSQWLRQQGVSPYGTLLPNVNGRVPLTRFTGDPSFGGYDVEQKTLGYSLEHRFSPQLTLRQGLRYEEESGTGNFVANGVLQPNHRLQNRTANRQYMDYDILVSDTSLLAQLQTGPVRHQLVVGIDARKGHSLLGARACRIAPLDLFNPVYGVAATCPDKLTSDAPSTLSVAGLYLQDQLKFGDGWTALLGLRHDRSKERTEDRIRSTRLDQNSEATVGSAGLVKEFAPGWSAYASWAESFLPVSGLTFGGRPFDPETGEQWELGLKHEALDGRITSSLALFELTRQNVTTADQINTGFSVQTGEQRSRGLELELGARFKNGLNLTAGYAYTDAKVTRDNNGAIVGLPINLQPRHTASLWALYKLPAVPALTLGLGGRAVSEQRGSLPFTLPGYAVLDASLSYGAPTWRLTAGVKNLLDRTYYDGAINANVVSPAMPRNWSLGLQLMY